MVKLGKPKTSFDKAVGEIEAYMKNPAVSYSLKFSISSVFNWIMYYQANDVIITPARKKSITKVRPSNASEDIPVPVPVEENQGANHIESGEDETPKKVNKVIPVKRSTVSHSNVFKSMSINYVQFTAKEAKTSEFKEEEIGD